MDVAIFENLLYRNEYYRAEVKIKVYKGDYFLATTNL